MRPTFGCFYLKAYVLGVLRSEPGQNGRLPILVALIVASALTLLVLLVMDDPEMELMNHLDCLHVLD